MVQVQFKPSRGVDVIAVPLEPVENANMKIKFIKFAIFLVPVILLLCLPCVKMSNSIDLEQLQTLLTMLAGQSDPELSKPTTTTTTTTTTEAPKVPQMSTNDINQLQIQLQMFQQSLQGLQNTLQTLEHLQQKPQVALPTVVVVDHCTQHGCCGEKNKTKPHFFKRLKIPAGSTLSLDVQLSNPKVLTGLFYQPEGIITDTVLEIPLWIDLAKFEKYMYDEKWKPHNHTLGSKPKTRAGDEEGRAIGAERCYIYKQVEKFASVALHITAETAHKCLLRTICEIHSLLSFWRHYENASLIFELLHLLLSPSEGTEDDCHTPYKKAEHVGRRKKVCYKYHNACPISIASILIANFVPSIFSA